MQPVCATDRRFSRGGFANLWKDEGSGVYLVRAKVCGRPFVRSLHTKSKAIAKTRMDEEIRLERLRRQRAAGEVIFEMGARFEDVILEWSAGVDADPKLKPRAKQYRHETLRQITKSWPEFDQLAPASVSKSEVEAWARRLQKAYSASRFNGAVQTMRGLFALAQEHGLAAENLAAKIGFLEVPPKARDLPGSAQFERMLKLLNRPRTKPAWAFVSVLAFSGQRPEGVRRLMPEHVDLRRNVIRWAPVKHNREFNEVPLSTRLRAALAWLLKHHPRDGTPLLPIKNPRRSLKSASVAAGIVPALTPGALRHLWTTRGLAAGVLITDMAWLRGDKDGGIMMAKTYNHARLEQLKRAVRKMR